MGKAKDGEVPIADGDKLRNAAAVGPSAFAPTPALDGTIATVANLGAGVDACVARAAATIGPAVDAELENESPASIPASVAKAMGFAAETAAALVRLAALSGIATADLRAVLAGAGVSTAGPGV